MSGDPPFTNIGVNYFGPFYVQQGHSNVKCYRCLFTCLVIGAVHIEVVNSLDANSFINVLRRFINLRGCPTTVYSDNRTNFQAGEVTPVVEQVESKINPQLSSSEEHHMEI